MNKRAIQEAKEYLAHDIAPTLTPTIRGEFQVRVIGVHRNAVEIELRIVEPGNPDRSLFSFGSKVISPGKTITLNGLESVINFQPR